MFRYRQKMTSAACSFALKQSGSSCGLPCQYGLLLSSILLLPCSYADLRDPTPPVYVPISVEQVSVPVVKELAVAEIKQNRLKTLQLLPPIQH